MNECDEGTDNCHQNATCNNTEGSFDCSCNTGYTGNGSFCMGKCIWYSDPLYYYFLCATLIPVYLSFYMHCIHHNIKHMDLIILTLPPTSCLVSADVNECAESTHNCHQNATCNNTEGSFDCSCNIGYTGNGSFCMGKRIW